MFPVVLAASLLVGEFPVVEFHAVRYVRVRNEEEAKSVSLIVNQVFNETSVITPPLLEGNMVRIDLGVYARNEKDFNRLVDTWEELRFDPAFNVLKIVEGKVFRQSLHDPKLCKQLGTEAPVVDFDYFNTRVRSSIKDQFGDSTIFGGLYYQFTGTPPKENDLIKKLGVEFGDDLFTFFEKLPSQMRTAQKKSAVTGKPRRIDFVAALSKFFGWIIITRDVEDGKQSGKFDPLESLKRMIVAASEIIYTKPNGLHGFALYDGKGDLQDEAPNKIVAADPYRDRNGNRNPHNTRLQIESCWNCHWAQGDSRGLISVQNDILTRQKRNVVINDPILRQLYRGDPDTPGEDLWLLFNRGRDDLTMAVYKTTNIGVVTKIGWPGDPTGKNVVKLSAEFITRRYQEYNYEPIDVRVALQEIGVQNVPEKKAEAILLFNQVVPFQYGENPDINDLRNGDELDRFHWSLVRAEVFLRRKK